MIFKTGGHFTNLTQVSCFIAEQLITQISSRTHKPNVSLFRVYTGNRRIEKARAKISSKLGSDLPANLEHWIDIFNDMRWAS